MTLFKQKNVYHLRIFVAYSFTVTVQIPKDFIKTDDEPESGYRNMYNLFDLMLFLKFVSS